MERSFEGAKLLPFLVICGLYDQVIDDTVRFVDVVEGAIPQTAHGWIVFFPSDVVASLIQQFKRAAIAAAAVHLPGDRRVIVQILAVVNRGPLDFVDGFINLVDGVLFFFVHVMGGSQVLQMSARGPQIGERVQVCRMPSRFVGEGQRGAEGDNKREYGATSYSFHGFLEAFRQNKLR